MNKIEELIARMQVLRQAKMAMLTQLGRVSLGTGEFDMVWYKFLVFDNLQAALATQLRTVIETEEVFVILDR